MRNPYTLITIVAASLVLGGCSELVFPGSGPYGSPTSRGPAPRPDAGASVEGGAIYTTCVATPAVRRHYERLGVAEMPIIYGWVLRQIPSADGATRNRLRDYLRKEWPTWNATRLVMIDDEEKKPLDVPYIMYYAKRSQLDEVIARHRGFIEFLSTVFPKAKFCVWNTPWNEPTDAADTESWERFWHTYFTALGRHLGAISPALYLASPANADSGMWDTRLTAARRWADEFGVPLIPQMSDRYKATAPEPYRLDQLDADTVRRQVEYLERFGIDGIAVWSELVYYWQMAWQRPTHATREDVPPTWEASRGSGPWTNGEAGHWDHHRGSFREHHVPWNCANGKDIQDREDELIVEFYRMLRDAM